MSKIKEIGDDVVISGVSGRFPNSRNMHEFAENLYNKIDMVDEEEKRWKHVNPECPKRMGKIDDIEKFDASFFGVSYRQARTMDPQCRMMLEHAYEAVIDSGMCPKQLRGTKTGVFIGMSYNESEKKWIYENISKEGLGITGSAKALVANRVSFVLGTTGPSFVLDTACSSSMYALDIAYKMISSGECDAAIVGGTNLCLHPHLSYQFVKLGVVSKDGYCRPFDKDASGFTRAETNCVLFLQRRIDAKRVYATVLHSKTNCDGFKEEGINFPSSKRQAQLLTEFYNEVGIPPNDPEIGYFEAHCTGTKVGDAEECKAIDEVMCKNRKEPLLIGSVKSNMGHSEPGSGVCSISKVILTFENGKIPPNINLKTVKPEITGVIEGRMKIVTETQDLLQPFIPVNSSGFGGANCHVLLQINPKTKVNKGIPNDRIPRLIFWSGRTEEAVNEILDSVTTQPLDAEYIALLQSSQAESVISNLYKGYAVYIQDNDNNINAACVTREVQHFNGHKRPMVWIYSGMGSQWCAMGAALMKIPIFANAIETCHNVLLTRGLNLKDIITSADPSTFNNILHSFIGIAAIQVGLTDVLKAVGLEPDYIVGHSLGELGCAYADNCCTAEEMILSAYSRGMVSLETKVVFGSMAAVGLGYNQLKNILPDGVEIACHNSFESSTISGPAENVAKFVTELKSQGIFAKEVNCSNIPYHSSYISEMGLNLLARLQKIHKPMKRSSKWISSSIPQSEWHLDKAKYTSAEYQTNNVLNPVLFEEAINHLPKNAVCIEIAPYGLLQAILKRSLSDSVHVALTKKGDVNNDQFMLSALGKIYCNGYDMDISNLFPKIHFPVSRGTKMISPYIKWDHSEDHYVMRFEDCSEGKSAERKVPISLNDVEYEYIQGHCIDGRCLFPATGYIFLAWETFAMTKGKMYFDMNVEFEDLKFLRATSLTKDYDVELTIVIQPGTGKFEISEGSSTIVTGNIKQVESPKLKVFQKSSKSNVLKSRDFYKELRLRGYHYSDIFQSVIEGSFNGSYGKIKWDSNWIAFLDCLLQLKIIGKDTRSLVLPTAIQKVTIHTSKHLEELKNFADESEAYFNAFINEDLNIIQCGGVEIVNLQSSSVGRRKPLGVPVLNSYEFVPYECTNLMNRSNAARIISQLLIENLQITKVKAVEIDSTEGVETILSDIKNALMDMPLITCEMTFLSSRTIEDLNDIIVADEKIALHKDCTIIITSNEVKDEHLESLIDSGYLLVRNLKNLQNISKCCIKISSIKTDNEIFTLFLHKKKNEETKPTAIVVSNNDTTFKWINVAKSLIKSTPLIIVAENEMTSGIIGLVNCLRKEIDGKLVRCLFIDDLTAPTFEVNNEFYQKQINLNLAINVYRNGRWGSYRHLPLIYDIEEKSTKEHCFANALVKSDLSSLKWLQGPLNIKDDGIVKVHYAPLNFKDVMLATGKISAEIFVNTRLDLECVLGFEYSGISKNGKRVMGLIPSGALSTFIKLDPVLTWECPKEWSLAEAATIPCVYSTVYYAFFIKSQIQKGKSILIHSGSGGIGLAAIRIAFAYGLEVFTTVSTEEKKNFLLNEFPQLKRDNIGNSRDTSFEEMIAVRTKGKGVDYVLNSLAEEKLHASIRCLGKGGKFLEIGKFDMEKDTKIGMSYFLKELSFHSIMLDQIFYASTDAKLRLRSILDLDIKNGIIKPFKTNIFQANQIEQAFRYLASGKHMGKVILQIRKNENDIDTLPITAFPRVYCNPEHSYIFPGGLGGFGLELADWLILRGCKKLILSSSRGITKPYQAYRIKIWESYGVKVVINTSDISSKSGCEKLIQEALKYGAVGGIFNLAAQLRDSIFENQDPIKFVECMGPKAFATKYLDELSRTLCPELKYFVVFSSVACGLGNAGQTNYGMANSVMERIMEQRNKLGLPAKAIQWGAVGEVGLVADLLEDKLDMEIGGTLQQRISSCLEELDGLISVKNPIVSSMVVAEKQFSSTKSSNVLEVILNIMGIRDAKSISMETTFAELGMDSLMTVEIQQTLEREHNFVISTQDLRSLTLTKLIENVGSKGATISKENDELMNGMNILIRNLGNEKDSQELLMELSNDKKGNRLTIFVPGIEGVGGDIWNQMANKIDGVSLIIQHKNIEDTSSFNSFVNEIFFKSFDTIKNFKEIHIIGFSFGSLIALKLASILENHGKTIKLTLIDGSPLFLTKLMKNFLGTHKFEDIIETLVLKCIVEKIIPNEASKVAHIIQSKLLLDEKVTNLLKEFEGLRIYSQKYAIEIVNAIVKRLRLIHNLNIDEFKTFRNIKLKLIRPQKSSLKNIEDDYGLKIFSNETIDIKFVSGDHLTMLDTEEFKNILKDNN